MATTTTKTDPQYLVDTKNASGETLYALYDIAKQAGISNPSGMSSSQLTSAIKQATGTSGNTYGNTIGNKTLNQYGYKVVNGQLVKTSPAGDVSVSGVANATVGDSGAAFVPGYGSTMFNPASDVYNMAETNYQNYLANQELLNNSYNQYITALNGGADNANAALDNARSNAIDQIQRTYDDSARNYYRLYKQQDNDLPEQLSSIGATGGASESAALNLMNKYSDNLYQNESGRNQQLSGVNEDYYNAVAQNSQQLAQQLANAYLQLGNAQLSLNNDYNNSVSSIMQYMQQQKAAEQEAAAQAEAEAAQRAIDEWNAAVSKNIALRTSQGYDPQTWYDADGKLHYTIAGQSLPSNLISSGSSSSSSSSSSSKSTGSSSKSTGSSSKSTGSSGSSSSSSSGSSSSGLSDAGKQLLAFGIQQGIQAPTGYVLNTGPFSSLVNALGATGTYNLLSK